jgi:hypothetical protein
MAESSAHLIRWADKFHISSCRITASFVKLHDKIPHFGPKNMQLIF